ncbi:response regulator with CheY-like receiver domain and winged-helix DNA-binding domain [Desulfitobacterium dichloroeliminans LMG P-21439]|uniref:Stage 0 sporulation protein A homolog n=1 Tax=Desulfitobacterium dichloroeliminans (strain LMG P-21439 / DCA1) TaxID=871963 RepID=L0FC25_DESDL|nr:response regulator transcription factor [Desulfitobacterium dichloroeliminans]AGA70206.1 response regulator with CheY-like receiver domain and winged-helix DNA-binding domain [Desulfitobacterium dichloroeliminans LMG P-21439]
MAVILVVDDDELIQELLKFNLEKEGYQVLMASDGPEALRVIKEKLPDLVVLDIMLPGMSGLEVCNQLRRVPKLADLPVIMLTAKGEEIDKVLGLEIGADDYITKPFSPRELVARIRARLRRNKPSEEGADIVRQDLRIDLERFRVSVRGEYIELTPKEFELLRVLATHPGKVYTRDELLERIWGYEYAGDTRTVDVHVRHLRQKIEKDPSDPDYIETLRGIGYRLKG